MKRFRKLLSVLGLIAILLIILVGTITLSNVGTRKDLEITKEKLAALEAITPEQHYAAAKKVLLEKKQREEAMIKDMDLSWKEAFSQFCAQFPVVLKFIFFQPFGKKEVKP